MSPRYGTAMTEVRLFGTCLAEEFYPSAVDAAAQVLRGLKLKVRPIRRAFCCGQAAFNEGMREQATELARRFLGACEPGKPVVVPSGSCQECCGFGGMFSVKFPHISGGMLADKVASVRESGADTVVANDCGCLMQIGGGLSRAGLDIETRHLAEVLASR